MANQEYLLEVARIDETIDNFKKEHTGYTSIEVASEETKRKVTITQKKDRGVLNIFIKRGGNVSFQIQAKLTSECKKLQDYIISECEMPCSDIKQYKTEYIDLEEFDSFVDILRDDEDFDVSDISVNGNGERSRCKIKNKSGAVVTVTSYNTKTVTLQGKVTPLFVQILGIISKDIADGTFAKELEIINGIQNAINEEIKIEDYISDMDSLSKIYKKLIESSVNLANAAVVINDNSGLITSMMKAIEGLMTDKLSKKLEISKTFDYFDKTGDGFVFRPEYDYFSDDDNKVLVESYTFWHDYRHPYLHIDKYDTQGTQILTYGNALDIIKKGLTIVDKLLKIL